MVNLNGFTVRATVFGVQCTYGGNVSANGYNGANANRPVTSNGQAQVNMAGITINKPAGPVRCGAAPADWGGGPPPPAAFHTNGWAVPSTVPPYRVPPPPGACPERPCG